MATVHVDQTGVTVIGEAIEVIGSGQINFTSIGGAPTEQYYAELKQVVYQLDPTLPNGYTAANFVPDNPQVNPISSDLIRIHPAVNDNYSQKVWVGILVHELLHESRDIDELAFDLAGDVGSATNASSGQTQTMKNLFEEMTVRARVETVANDNPGLVSEAGQFPDDEAGIRNLIETYRGIYAAQGRPPITDAQANAIVEAIVSGQLNQTSTISAPGAGSTGSTGGGSGIVGFLSSVGQAIERAVTAVAEAIGNVFESITSFFSGGSATAPASPIILDLDSDGVETSIQTNGASFDFDGDGYREAGAWVGKDDGFLVLDRPDDGGDGTGDGKITRPDELLLSLLTADTSDTDLEALSASSLNSNRATVAVTLASGSVVQMQVLNAQDTGWDRLRIWQDSDQDGEVDVGELKSLTSLGITQINLAYDDGSAFDNRDNDIQIGLATLHGMASFVRNGDTFVGGVGDLTLGHETLGWKRTELAGGGYEYVFESGKKLRHININFDDSLDSTAHNVSANFDLAANAFDAAEGDERGNTLTAIGHSRSVHLSGRNGNDVLHGGNGDDLLSGGAGVDALRGYAGNDFIVADAADFAGVVDGGDGIDTLFIEGGDAVSVTLINHSFETATGGAGNDTFSGAGYADDINITGGVGNDSILGGDGDDVLGGDVGADYILGGEGDDLLNGGSGGDSIRGEDGDDQVYGDTGNDTLRGSGQDDRIYGGSGADALYGGTSDDFISGGSDADTLVAGLGDDTLEGGSGDDFLSFWNGDSELWGQSGNDTFRLEKIVSEHGSAVHWGRVAAFGGKGADTLVLHGTRTSWDISFVEGNQWLLHRRSVENPEERIVIEVVDIERLQFSDGGDDRVLGAFEADDTSDDYVRTYRAGTGDDDTQANGAFTNVYSGTFLGWMGDDTLRGAVASQYSVIEGTFTGIDGGTGNDVIVGTSRDETLVGGSGQDRVYGGADEDTITGNSGADVISGGDANDSINGGSGADALAGDAGDDLVYGGSGNDTLHGGIGVDRLRGGTGSDQISGGDGNDHLFGDTGFDRLYGDIGNDYVVGGAGSDYLYGGAGNDTLRGGADTIVGADSQVGDDAFTTGGVNYLAGGDGNDLLFGASQDDQMSGDAGNDSLFGGDGRDILLGGVGADSLDGGSGARDMVSYETSQTAVSLDLSTSSATFGDATGDTLANFEHAAGGSGNDSLYGSVSNPTGSGDNVLVGNDGNDLLDGKSGDDDLFGGVGADSLLGSGGVDRLYGDDDSDTMRGGDGEDTLYGGDGIDLIYGDVGDDLLEGGGSGDTLYGGDGADKLVGGNSNDSMMGDDGDDTLIGGSGHDVLSGNVGADVFVFNAALDAATNVDTITYYSNIDMIHLESDIFAAIGSALTSSEFRSIETGTSFAEVDSSDRIIYLQSTGELYYDADGSGATARIKFAQATAETALTVDDFVII